MWRYNWMKSGRLRITKLRQRGLIPLSPKGRGECPLTVSSALFTRQFFQIGFNLADLIGYD